MFEGSHTFDRIAEVLNDEHTKNGLFPPKLVATVTDNASNFKKAFKIENYLLQFPTHFRRNLTKLRISAHNLAIETGRYSKPVETPVEKRLCFHCNEIESEFHFFLKCALYKTERNILFTNLSNFISIDLNPSSELFNLLMSDLDGDLEVGRSVCNFINDSIKIRSELLSYKTEIRICQRANSVVTRSGRLSKRREILDL